MTSPVPRSFRYEWGLFVDWCAAVDIAAVPVSAASVAQFFHEHPAKDSVQLRRISAINHAHRTCGHYPPGRVTSIRVEIDSIRAERIRRRGEQLRVSAAALPTAGGVEAVFGRRDAVLLMVAGAGLSYRAISELDRSDVAVDGGDVWIGGRHRLLIPGASALAAGEWSPAAVWQRWIAVLAFSDRYPSTTLLAEQLQRGTMPERVTGELRPGPVAVPIDRWGHMPYPVEAMSPAAVAAVVQAHLAGTVGRRVRRRTLPRTDECVDCEHVVTESYSAVVLDTGYYDAGVAARRRAHESLAEVPDLVDGVEDRIEELPRQTLAILGDAGATD